MSQQEVIDTIEQVARRLAPKFTFAYFGVEDIEQEAFMMGMEALERYDESKPLENFMYVHIKNRLKNFKRDNYYRQDEGTAQQIQARKRNLLEPANIESFYFADDKDAIMDQASVNEIKSLIDQKLPVSMRGDYLRLCAGFPISNQRRSEIVTTIKEILEL